MKAVGSRQILGAGSVADPREEETTLSAARREREARLMEGIVPPPRLDFTIPRGRQFIDTILMKCFVVVLVAGLYWSAASRWGWTLPW
jgi:hypothetical protein